MARTAGQVGMPGNSAMPEPGWHECECVGAERWKSPKAGTPAVMLKWRTLDMGVFFEDPVFVTVKAMGRLNLVAQRVAGMPETTALPDDDKAAAGFFARYILDHAPGGVARVLVEEQVEEFIYQDGPKVGQKGEKKRRRVAFAGYETVVAGSAPSPAPPPPAHADAAAPPPPPPEDSEENIPF